mmetsp:Transcript_82119/g.96022  ORF Transcript_82119/g.96022 Transcript_82119/m.96022 type:complete len:87 (+) Transcript_82119:1792-2052(+)
MERSTQSHSFVSIHVSSNFSVLANKILKDLLNFWDSQSTSEHFNGIDISKSLSSLVQNLLNRTSQQGEFSLINLFKLRSLNSGLEI